MVNTPTAYRCDKPGCTYEAHGRSRREAIARMARHWTANDHRAHVDAIIAEKEGEG